MVLYCHQLAGMPGVSLSICLGLVFLSWRFSNGVHRNLLWAGGLSEDYDDVSDDIALEDDLALYKVWGNRESLNTAVFWHYFLWPPNSTRTFTDCSYELFIFI